MSADPDSENTVKELRAKLKALESEHRRLRHEYARFKLGMRVFARAMTSFGLPRRLREYREVANTENPFPSPQTENLAASLMNRVIIGSAFALIAGFGTLSLLGFQTYYLARHATTLQNQAQILERQAVQQQETTDRIRRTELADKLFRAECFPSFKANLCADARHVVADTSAALEEYIEAERRRLKLSYNPDWRKEEVSPCAGISFDKYGRVSDRLVNLRKIQLSLKTQDEVIGLSLPGKDLSCVDLTGSHLENADLTGSDFSGSRLHAANLQGAKLNQVNLLDTEGVTMAKLDGAEMRATLNLYCDYSDQLTQVLKGNFSIKDDCNTAEDKLVHAY